MARTAVGVMVRPLEAERCKPKLLAGYSAPWVVGLYAAMLRDTLDGLQAIDAFHHVVFLASEDATDATDRESDEVMRLARHVPAPWEIVVQTGGDRGARMRQAFEAMFAQGAEYAWLAVSDTPSVPTDPIRAFSARKEAPVEIVLGPSEDGGCYVLGMPRLEAHVLHEIPWSTADVSATIRARCADGALALRELPIGYDVDDPEGVRRLFEELRRHPERAPRTAQFLVTTA